MHAERKAAKKDLQKLLNVLRNEYYEHCAELQQETAKRKAALAQVPPRRPLVHHTSCAVPAEELETGRDSGGTPPARTHQPPACEHPRPPTPPGCP